MTASAHRAPLPVLVGKYREFKMGAAAAPEPSLNGGMVIDRDLIAAFGGGDAETGRRELRNMLSSYRDRKFRMPPTPRPDVVRWAEPGAGEGSMKIAGYGEVRINPPPTVEDDCYAAMAFRLMRGCELRDYAPEMFARVVASDYSSIFNTPQFPAEGAWIE
jgi:hypothetical protein